MGGALHTIDKARHVPMPRYLIHDCFHATGDVLILVVCFIWSSRVICMQELILGQVTRTAAARCEKENGRSCPSPLFYYPPYIIGKHLQSQLILRLRIRTVTVHVHGWVSVAFSFRKEGLFLSASANESSTKRCSSFRAVSFTAFVGNAPEAWAFLQP